MEQWPPIPTVVPGIIGPIRVVIVEVIDDDPTCGGIWRADSRTVEVVRHEHPANMWWVLFHELGHSYMDDMRVPLSANREEEVVNAIATGRMQELRLQIGSL